MSTALFDPSWYRVADLKPRIRAHAQFHRHEYRGQIWHVLQDHSSERFHRFAPEAYFMIGRMDGKRTVQDIWQHAIDVLGDDAPTQSETIQVLSHLHTADVLQSDVTPDSAEILKRHQRRRRQTRWQRIKSPLAIRIPLIDPERVLERLDGVARVAFSWFGALLWLVVVGSAALLAASHWPELSENVTERVLAPQNLLILWLTFPALKALHEIGHGMAVKTWGGEVHEMGIMILVLMPIPYVDASAASAFRQRSRRVVVGAAGMIVEIFIAALAMFVWLNVEPGIVRAVAYNVMLIAGVSTVLFNGNPLLRFDGYYILADLINIPNLASRSNRYLAYLAQRYGLGVRDAEPPMGTSGEKWWFVGFGVASFIYRLFIYAFIILFIAGKFFFIGVLLALWAAFTMIVQPVFKGMKFVFTNQRLRKNRGRAITTTLAAVAAVGSIIAFLPLPHFTRAEGVVWVPEQSIVRLGTSGFVDKLAVDSGATVSRGDLLLTLTDRELATEVEVVEHQLNEARARRRALQVDDAVQAEITDEEIAGLQARLERLAERVSALSVRAPIDGRYVSASQEDTLGRFFPQGKQIAYVIAPGDSTVRVVVEQSRVDLVRQRVKDVEVRLANAASNTIKAAILREVPAATTELPSLALGSSGGGQVALDPRASDSPQSLESLFQFDLQLAESTSEFLGGRLYVRFDHGLETLGGRWYRAIRQLLLARFDV